MLSILTTDTQSKIKFHLYALPFQTVNMFLLKSQQKPLSVDVIKQTENMADELREALTVTSSEQLSPVLGAY